MLYFFVKQHYVINQNCKNFCLFDNLISCLCENHSIFCHGTITNLCLCCTIHFVQQTIYHIETQAVLLTHSKELNICYNKIMHSFGRHLCSQDAFIFISTRICYNAFMEYTKTAELVVKL